MRSYLVTGGTGYLGSRLVRHLTARGDRVVFLYRPTTKAQLPVDHNNLIVLLPVSASPGTYGQAIQQYGVEAIFHLASNARYFCQADEVASMIEANVTLGTQLMEAITTTECRRFVNVGTYWQHFNGPDYNPTCLYAASKQAFMDIATYYTKWRGVSCISLKLTDVYGDNDSRSKIFSLINKAAETQEKLKLTKGEQLVSFLHVEDAVKALCEAAAQTSALGGRAQVLQCRHVAHQLERCR